jgi:hypothetical protein
MMRLKQLNEKPIDDTKRENKDKFVLVTSPIQHDESPSTSKIHRESRQYAIPQYHSQHPEVALSVSRRRVRPLTLDPNRRQAISGGARMRTLDNPSLNSARLNSRRHTAQRGLLSSAGHQNG